MMTANEFYLNNFLIGPSSIVQYPINFLVIA